VWIESKRRERGRTSAKSKAKVWARGERQTANEGFGEARVSMLRPGRRSWGAQGGARETGSSQGGSLRDETRRGQEGQCARRRKATFSASARRTELAVAVVAVRRADAVVRGRALEEGLQGGRRSVSCGSGRSRRRARTHPAAVLRVKVEVGTAAVTVTVAVATGAVTVAAPVALRVAESRVALALADAGLLGGVAESANLDDAGLTGVVGCRLYRWEASARGSSQEGEREKEEKATHGRR